MSANQSMISSDRVNGTDVYSANREKIGEIDHLMIDRQSGRVAYAVMSFGGFLGMGQSHYPIPWPSLSYDEGMGGYTTGITEEQVKNAPTVETSRFGERDWEKSTYDHYTAPYYWR